LQKDRLLAYFIRKKYQINITKRPDKWYYLNIQAIKNEGEDYDKNTSRRRTVDTIPS
jgi:hypothetical protein